MLSFHLVRLRLRQNGLFRSLPYPHCHEDWHHLLFSLSLGSDRAAGGDRGFQSSLKCMFTIVHHVDMTTDRREGTRYGRHA